MNQLTAAQKTTLNLMPYYHVVSQFAKGAVVAVYEQRYQEASVIDTDGRVYSFSRYLALIDVRAERPGGPRATVAHRGWSP